MTSERAPVGVALQEAYCRVYKIWDLTNYSILYTISEPSLEEVKLRYSSGVRRFLILIVLQPGHCAADLQA